MSDEDGFLNAILANPADDMVRLVYSDWLEERGDLESIKKADYLRLSTSRVSPEGKKGRKSHYKKLGFLAAKLDADWLAVVSRLQVDLCAKKVEESSRVPGYPYGFSFVCDRRWEDLNPTDDPRVRSCDGCHKDVYYSRSIDEAQSHGRKGRCVAVALHVLRKERDLFPGDQWFPSDLVGVLAYPRLRD